MDKGTRDKYTVVIGLEVHAQLLTKSKIFAADSTEFGNMPNTNVSVITLGHPGTLPKVNRKAVEFAIRMGLACESKITRENLFDRKNYFYPDLPKGYQITQDKSPICVGGYVTVKTADGITRDIRLNRVHMEEDAGKSIHLAEEVDTLVDYNRAGVPLIEIVTEPDIRSSEEAYVFLTEVRKLVRYLDICDGNMEEGSMRCDANISVMLNDATEYGKKVEVKNMNSIRNVQRAIDHEVIRQIEQLEKGEAIISETRTFDAAKCTTASMRTKEDLNDYRYFPEPDLSPLIISDTWLEQIKASMPSLPKALFQKFVQEFQLPEYDAQVLTDSKGMAHYFQALCEETSNYKAASNWMMGPIKSYLNEFSLHISQFPVSPKQIATLIKLVDSGSVNFSIASQKIYPAMIKAPGKDPRQIAEEMNLLQESNSATIIPIVDEVLASLPQKVSEYKSGKKGILGLFMGEIMKKSKGKADPKIASELLKERLD